MFFGPAEVLTDRELDVLRGLSSGKTREAIAADQYISVNTLKAHLSAVYRKVAAKSRAQALAEAERRGLL